ncbi:MAG: beta-ketoacyl synthase chain length factor [Thiohalocapsa sp.]
MRVAALGVGTIAPGLPDWTAAAAVLRGERPYQAQPLAVPPPASLSPNERRRATLATRLALTAAQQATEVAEHRSSDLLGVFASSDGDMDLIDSMCRAVYERHEPPSPTVFQNSVHNAVAGYWSIAEGCRQASTSIAAGDGSFAAGLLEAATQASTMGKPVLLVAFDVPAPELLHSHRNFGCAFACALLLAPAAQADDDPLLTLALPDEAQSKPDTPMADYALEVMRAGNPAARSLPLLAALAGVGPALVRLPYWPDLPLEVQLEPDP